MSNRRDFIKTLGLLSLGGLLNPQDLFAARKNNIPLGIQLYTIRDIIGKDIHKLIPQLSAMGYSEVETYEYSVKNGFFGWQPKDFAKLLADHDMKAVSGHYEFGEYFAQKSNRQLKEAIEAASYLGSSYITVPGLEWAVRKTSDAYKKVAEKLNNAGELAAKSNLKIAYHNHEYEFKKLDQTSGYEIMLKETQAGLVDFELDIYWLMYSGYDPLKFIKSYPKRFTMWHLKDMNLENKNWNTEIGNGKLPVKELFKIAKSSGLKHCFVEQETQYKPNILGSVKASADFIKRLKI